METHVTAQHFIDYILNERHATRADLAIGEDVILTYAGLPQNIADWDLEPPKLSIFPRPVLSDGRITIIRGPVGAPHVASVIEELNALGARRIWVLGYAGSLTDLFHLGDVALIDRAWSDEGTSRHYGAFGWGHANPNLLAKLQPYLHKTPAAICSTDAIYRETAAKLAAFRSQGAALIDMETSCYFHVGAALGLQVAALMVVSDELTHGWRPGFVSDAVIKGAQAAWQVIWQAIRQGAVRP
ncbi:hypothetical protein [Sulfobacillus harzensis]|uniref:Uridine phosphorylase n=1 Tax=Sulfobacillus harzensis TaxID=2729629 RepID=A0A7Y0Q3P2_9FIRM|nr:hypothetical protein [Sulfobacillus harzensis]NMP22384.1 nucleoside phosphorylase [Sulfobacillus harzensis]